MAETIEEGRNIIQFINQDKHTQCGICLAAYLPNFGAVRVISGEPVSPPPSAEERVLVRTGGGSR
ncbi:MAG: hypothetical protein ABID84_01450 [Chloroflexota bacterium]